MAYGRQGGISAADLRPDGALGRLGFAVLRDIGVVAEPGREAKPEFGGFIVIMAGSA